MPTSRRRKFAIGCLGTMVVAAVASVIAFRANNVMTKVWDVPPPNIRRAASPQAIARGEKIFHVSCANCHVGDDGRASGKKMADFPAFIGIFYARNITSDPEAGIGAWSDEELARMIKTSIGRDRRGRAMPGFPGMADDDIAAVIGFLRSDSPLFQPSDVRQPAPVVTLLGQIIVTLAGGPDPHMRTGFNAPPVAATAEYGAYMANDVFDCIGCHTEGMTQSYKKVGKKGMYAGGFENHTPFGKVTSANITFDETGIAAYSADEFVRAVRDGITKDDRVLRFPMPQFRWPDDVDLRAIYEYLKTVPHVSRPHPKDREARPAATTETDPEKLFSALGCVGCHGPSAPYHDRIKHAASEDVDYLAKWIRDAPSLKPGVQMPTYARLLDEGRAKTLAGWVKKYAAAN